jgi:PadR family transcriptional regulator PadR
MKMKNDVTKDEKSTDIVDKLRLELRRGALPLAVLAQLREEHYGYSLRKHLNAKGLDIDEGTLYPLIRRLEKQGLLNSEWRKDEKRKKRYYRISELGETVLSLLTGEWRTLNESINGILGKEKS